MFTIFYSKTLQSTLEKSNEVEYCDLIGREGKMMMSYRQNYFSILPLEYPLAHPPSIVRGVHPNPLVIAQPESKKDSLLRTIKVSTVPATTGPFKAPSAPDLKWVN